MVVVRIHRLHVLPQLPCLGWPVQGILFHVLDPKYNRRSWLVGWLVSELIFTVLLNTDDIGYNYSLSDCLFDHVKLCRL